jgi:hypothetical protein
VSTGRQVPSVTSVLTDEAVAFAVSVIDSSGVPEYLESLLVRRTGPPRSLTVRALLVALFLLARSPPSASSSPTVADRLSPSGHGGGASASPTTALRQSPPEGRGPPPNERRRASSRSLTCKSQSTRFLKAPLER